MIKSYTTTLSIKHFYIIIHSFLSQFQRENSKIPSLD